MNKARVKAVETLPLKHDDKSKRTVGTRIKNDATKADLCKAYSE